MGVSMRFSWVWVLAGLLALWEGVVHFYALAPYVLPAPSAVALALVAHAPVLWAALLYTLFITWGALGIALLSGTLMGLAMHKNRLLSASILPLAVALQVTPVIAISPLIIQWVGVEHPERALLIVAWIVAFFPIVMGMLTGLQAIPKDWHDLFTLYQASPWQRFWRLEVPGCLPSLLGGIKVASGLALIGAIVAEFVVGTGTSQGLAWVLIQAIYMLEMPRAFACLVLITAVGLVQYAVLSALERRLFSKRGL
jgi:NitT/TauT family transport system permease protein